MKLKIKIFMIFSLIICFLANDMFSSTESWKAWAGFGPGYIESLRKAAIPLIVAGAGAWAGRATFRKGKEYYRYRIAKRVKEAAEKMNGEIFLKKVILDSKERDRLADVVKNGSFPDNKKIYFVVSDSGSKNSFAALDIGKKLYKDARRYIVEQNMLEPTYEERVLYNKVEIFNLFIQESVIKEDITQYVLMQNPEGLFNKNWVEFRNFIENLCKKVSKKTHFIFMTEDFDIINAITKPIPKTEEGTETENPEIENLNKCIEIIKLGTSQTSISQQSQDEMVSALKKTISEQEKKLDEFNRYISEQRQQQQQQEWERAKSSSLYQTNVPTSTTTESFRGYPKGVQQETGTGLYNQRPTFGTGTR